MHPQRWGHVKFHVYQQACSFYHWSQNEYVTKDVFGMELPEEQEMSVWADVEGRFI